MAMVNQLLAKKLKLLDIAKNDLSNINNAGKNVITGLGSVVKAGDNVVVKTETDATTGQKLIQLIPYPCCLHNSSWRKIN